MADSPFLMRISNRTFEHYSGHGYRDSGGREEELMAPEHFDSMHICFSSYIFDDSGKAIGCRFKNCKSGELTEVYPGKVYNINVWTTAVDDDGCPEDICISFYIQLIPNE